MKEDVKDSVTVGSRGEAKVKAFLMRLASGYSQSDACLMLDEQEVIETGCKKWSQP